MIIQELQGPTTQWRLHTFAMSRLRKGAGQRFIDADYRPLEMARTFVAVEHDDFFSVYSNWIYSHE